MGCGMSTITVSNEIFDLALHAQNLEQDGDAFTCGHHATDHGAQPAEWPRNHIDLLADFDARLNDDGLLVLHRVSKLVDDFRRHARGNFSKTDDLYHAARRSDLPALRDIAKPGENIAGKHRFGHPKLSGTAGALKANKRTKYFDAIFHFEKIARQPLVPRLRSKAIPFKIVCHVVI